MRALDLSEIEQGIKNAIVALQRPYITSVESYGGEFDEDLKNVVRKFPAIWTTFQGTGKPVQLSANKFRLPMVFVTLVGAYSIRNEETARTGIKINDEYIRIGTFQLLQDVQSALLNNDLKAFGVNGITPFVFGKIDKIFDRKTQDAAISIFAQQWHTSGILSSPVYEFDPDFKEANWMQLVNVDYMFKAGDDVADMSDLIKFKDL